jgi:sigma-B regulation protein RsbU (phosphoserine phosphatase)
MTHPPRAETARVSRIRQLTEVSRALTYAASLDQVFRLTTDRAAELLAGEMSLLLVANDDGLLELRASYGVDATLAKRVRVPLNEALAPRLAELLNVKRERFLGVPLVVAGAVHGLLVVIRSAPSKPSGGTEDEWLLSALADQAALALEKNHLDEIGVFREQLMAIVGHDLRSPLNTVQMAAELLMLHEGLGEQETELARKITRSTAMAIRLVDQLLDLTRSRLGGGIAIQPTTVNMEDVCHQVVVEAELTHPDRPLDVDMRGDLIGVWDRDRIYQLISNLVGNAVQHGEPRSRIAMRVNASEAEIVIEIANRGIPIPPAILPFIFDAFRQGRTNHARRKGGLGLGLFIAQQVARSHGGVIAATSTADEGTTFQVRLPRRAGPEIVRVADAPPRA